MVQSIPDTGRTMMNGSTLVRYSIAATDRYAEAVVVLWPQSLLFFVAWLIQAVGAPGVRVTCQIFHPAKRVPRFRLCPTRYAHVMPVPGATTVSS